LLDGISLAKELGYSWIADHLMRTKMGGTMEATAILMKKLPNMLITAMIAILCICIALTGCRKTHVGKSALAPKAPGPIKDLTGIRVGDEVSLNWTTPRKGISRLVVNGSLEMRVCRLESTESKCVEAARPQLLALGAVGRFAEELPAQMRSGPPRVANYFVEILDHNEGAIGFMNRVPVLVGAPPAPVQGLTAEASEKGVILRWSPESAGTAAGETSIRLSRTEGAPLVSRPEVDLFAPDESAGTLDTRIRKGTTYQYRAQRVFRIVVDGQTLEMDGQISPEVEINLPR
jgi:hypothetical protein